MLGNLLTTSAVDAFGLVLSDDNILDCYKVSLISVTTKF